MSSTIISISIPEDLLSRLNSFCDIEERSKSFCVRKALEKYLEENRLLKTSSGKASQNKQKKIKKK